MSTQRSWLEFLSLALIAAAACSAEGRGEACTTSVLLENVPCKFVTKWGHRRGVLDEVRDGRPLNFTFLQNGVELVQGDIFKRMRRDSNGELVVDDMDDLANALVDIVKRRIPDFPYPLQMNKQIGHVVNTKDYAGASTDLHKDGVFGGPPSTALRTNGRLSVAAFWIPLQRIEQNPLVFRPLDTPFNALFHMGLRDMLVTDEERSGYFVLPDMEIGEAILYNSGFVPHDGLTTQPGEMGSRSAALIDVLTPRRTVTS